MARLGFDIAAQNEKARTGSLLTRRGPVPTPAFMPVGTAATVKSLLPEEVAAAGASIILANTYHLLLRPGVEVVQKLGGVHRFMDWPGPVLTDSGGFQVFSLASMRKVEEKGVTFRSHLNGDLMQLSPERAIEAQEALGSDIMMMLDECPPAGASREYLDSALERDARWAKRARDVRGESSGALMGIIQGGVHEDLRQKSVELLGELELDGYALGGLSVGEPKERMYEVIEATVPLLPAGKPVYLMGVGAPEDLVRAVGLGVDMFDCVMPTRMARTGTFMTKNGRLNIRNARFADDAGPVEQHCGCMTCQRFSRAYLRHLFMAGELLGYRLGSIHNLYFILSLMERLRAAIHDNNYQRFASGVLDQLNLRPREEQVASKGGNHV